MKNRSGAAGRSGPRVLAASAWNALRANGRSLLGVTPAPRALCVYVTTACNLRCRTCGIWEATPGAAGPELTLPELEAILADPLFAALDTMNLNGGEPNLRPDLPDIAGLLLRRARPLRSLSLNSNGIPTSTTVRNATRLTALCSRRGVPFSLSISLHARGPLFDELAGVAGAWAQVEATLAELAALSREGGFMLTANCVISAHNLHVLEDMREWSRATGIPVNFVLAEARERFHNRESGGRFLLRPEQRAEAGRFFRRLSRDEPRLRHHRLRYRVLADMLERGAPRRLACHYRLGGAILGSRGELFYCKASRAIGNCRERPAREIYFDPLALRYRRQELIAETCRRCPPNTLNRIELEKDLLRFLAFAAGAALHPSHGRP
jgi:MoaA/NifB/PqqE/SkfB family radical SAM enzyme